MRTKGQSPVRGLMQESGRGRSNSLNLEGSKLKYSSNIFIEAIIETEDTKNPNDVDEDKCMSEPGNETGDDLESLSSSSMSEFLNRPNLLETSALKNKGNNKGQKCHRSVSFAEEKQKKFLSTIIDEEPISESPNGLLSQPSSALQQTRSLSSSSDFSLREHHFDSVLVPTATMSTSSLSDEFMINLERRSSLPDVDVDDDMMDTGSADFWSSFKPPHESTPDISEASKSGKNKLSHRKNTLRKMRNTPATISGGSPRSPRKPKKFQNYFSTSRKTSQSDLNAKAKQVSVSTLKAGSIKSLGSLFVYPSQTTQDMLLTIKEMGLTEVANNDIDLFLEINGIKRKLYLNDMLHPQVDVPDATLIVNVYEGKRPPDPDTPNRRRKSLHHLISGSFRTKERTGSMDGLSSFEEEDEPSMITYKNVKAMVRDIPSLTEQKSLSWFPLFFRLLITPNELLDELTQALIELKGSNTIAISSISQLTLRVGYENKESGSVDYVEKGARIINFTCKWIERSPFDFTGKNINSPISEIMALSIETFMDHVEGEFSENFCQKLTTRLDKAKDFDYISIQEMDSLLSIESISRSTNFDSLPLNSLINEIMDREFRHFSEVRPEAYLMTAMLSKKDRSERIIAKLEDYINWWNKLSSWVATEICLGGHRQKRTLLIERFIDIMSNLYRLNNYNSLCAIFGGLNHAAVTRLEKSWKEVSSDRKLTYNQMEDFLSPMSNYTNYRVSLKNNISNGHTTTPITSVIMKDLTSLKEVPSTFDDGTINMEKMFCTSSALQMIDDFRSQDCEKLEASNDCDGALTEISHYFDNLPYITDEHVLYHYSLLYEPRNNILTLSHKQDIIEMWDKRNDKPS